MDLMDLRWVSDGSPGTLRGIRTGEVLRLVGTAGLALVFGLHFGRRRSDNADLPGWIVFFYIYIYIQYVFFKRFLWHDFMFFVSVFKSKGDAYQVIRFRWFPDHKGLVSHAVSMVGSWRDLNQGSTHLHRKTH